MNAHNKTMSLEEKKRFRERFFRRSGDAVRYLVRMFEDLPNVGFYLKDKEQRFVAMNRHNRKDCNFLDEFDPIGRSSGELFPKVLAEHFMAFDRKVIASGQPLENQISEYTASRDATLSHKSVYPVFDRRHKVIGTMCVYLHKPNPDIVPSWHDQLKVVTRYIAEHYAEKIKLSQLAELIGASVVTLTAMFNKTLAISPGRYLLTTRLNVARQLLETTDKKLIDIALETGFCNHSHFVNTFRKERGMTPGEYRRQMQASRGR